MGQTYQFIGKSNDRLIDNTRYEFFLNPGDTVEQLDDSDICLYKNNDVNHYFYFSDYKHLFKPCKEKALITVDELNLILDSILNRKNEENIKIFIELVNQNKITEFIWNECLKLLRQRNYINNDTKIRYIITNICLTIEKELFIYVRELNKASFEAVLITDFIQNFDLSTEKALRYNSGKLKWSLVDFKSLEPMVKVLEFGAKKYSRDNWKKGLDTDELIDSLLRHCFEYKEGKRIDAESGEPIIGHMMCNVMFLSYQDLNKIEELTSKD